MKLCENINVRQILLDFNDISTSQARKKVEDRWTMDACACIIYYLTPNKLLYIPVPRSSLLYNLISLSSCYNYTFAVLHLLP